MPMSPPKLPIHRQTSQNQPSKLSGSTEPREDTLRKLIKEFEDYKFTEDPVFNAGLPNVFNAIRGKKMTPGLIDKTIAEAQWFYFTTRIKQTSTPFEAYTKYLDTHTPTPPSSGESSDSSSSSSSTKTAQPKSSSPKSSKRMNSLTEAMRMMEVKGTEGQTGLTFDNLCQLIRDGRADELKGKEIPDELNTSPPSQSTLSARPKPWQRKPCPNTPQPSNSNLVDTKETLANTSPHSSFQGTTSLSTLPNKTPQSSFQNTTPRSSLVDTSPQSSFPKPSSQSSLPTTTPLSSLPATTSQSSFVNTSPQSSFTDTSPQSSFTNLTPQSAFRHPFPGLPFPTQNPQQPNPINQFTYPTHINPSDTLINTFPLPSSSQLGEPDWTTYPDPTTQNYPGFLAQGLHDPYGLRGTNNQDQEPSSQMQSCENIGTPGSEYINWSAGDEDENNNINPLYWRPSTS